MNVLVTGATGFVGANLVRQLLKEGYSVRVIVRESASLKNINGLDIEIFYGDLLDKDSLLRAISGCDIVFHVAAHYSLWSREKKQLYKVNVEGTKNICESCFEKKIEKVVYTSTVGVLGISSDGTSGNEETPVKFSDMVGDYKKSKFLAEEEVKKFCNKGLPVVIVNPSTPIGPFDIKPTPTGKIIVDFLNKKLPAYLDTGLNIVDVEDVALGHILAAKKGRVGERYILGNKNLTFYEILKILENISKIKAPEIKIPYWLALISGYVSEGISYITCKYPFSPLAGVRMARKKMFFSSKRAVKELGLPQSSVELAFEKAIKWFCENGYVK